MSRDTALHCAFLPRYIAVLSYTDGYDSIFLWCHLSFSVLFQELSLYRCILEPDLQIWGFPGRVGYSTLLLPHLGGYPDGP